MNSDLYELLALAARYFFAGLMCVIVLRALQITVKDARRAAILRSAAPEADLVGEFTVLEGKLQGRSYSVIREGMIGKSPKADIRLKAKGIRKRHAYFEMTPKGLSVRAAGGVHIEGQKSVLLKDGDTLYLGSLRLMLILYEINRDTMGRQEYVREKEAENTPLQTEDLFDTDSQTVSAAEDSYDEFLQEQEEGNR